MVLVGYIVILISFFVMYKSYVEFGLIFFAIGGFLAGKISISLRSIGVILMVGSIFWGFRHGFTPFVFFVLFVGFVLASFNSRRTDGREDWGIDFLDLTEIFDGSSGGGDSGGDGGGGD